MNPQSAIRNSPSTYRRALLVVCLGTALVFPGCGKSPQASATADLAASFEGSPSKEDVLKANVAFDEGRY
jgi:hypothetical protein